MKSNIHFFRILFIGPLLLYWLVCGCISLFTSKGENVYRAEGLKGKLTFTSNTIFELPVNSFIQDTGYLNGVQRRFKYSFRKGDLLVRPNLNLLPGSSSVDSGTNFGHVVIVLKGAEGNDLDETLHRTLVVEAVLYDQKTRSFIFNAKNQVRVAPAEISFGKRFEGIRYRLRTNLDENQIRIMSEFLLRQIGQGSYDIFATKNNIEVLSLNNALSNDEPKKWNCATFAWYAFKKSSGIDIDSNHGYLIYPNDIILSSSFDFPDGRLRF
jgi:hypothetical protein